MQFPRALFLACALPLAACNTYDSQRIADEWGAARFDEAEKAIDALIADEAGVKADEVTASRGLSEAIDAAKGETSLLLLEKSNARLVDSDYDSAIDCLRRARDVLDTRFNQNDVGGWLNAALTDDRGIDFTGADYEHVMIPTLLALVDLLNGGQDAFAYALQIGEKQEAILGSTFGEDLDAGDGTKVGYNPRKSYQRVAIGAYMEGLVQEAKSSSSEAAKAYRRALEWSGDVDVVDAAVKRTTEGVYAQPGHGVVHVFYLAGRGPRLVSGTSSITEQAMLLATVGSIVIGHGIGTIGQTNVPVPVVWAQDTAISPLDVRGPNGAQALTSPILDLNRVASQQIEANLPWILARAAIRRSVKAVAAKAAMDAAGKDELGGVLAGIFTNLALTVGERADTRNWITLPAQVQVARLEVPEGAQTIDLGQGMSAQVNVAAGKDSYVAVVRPALALPGRVLVDVYSRPRVEGAVDAAPEPAPTQPSR